MNIREKQEQTELSLLSPYATRSIDTKYVPVSKETGIESCIVKLFVV